MPSATTVRARTDDQTGIDVDPVSHLVMGRAVVAAFDGPRRARFGTGASLAALTGALAPDVDCLLMPFGWDIYLRFHQSGTHSILGACVLGGGVGLLLSPLLRRRVGSLGRDQSTTAASGLALAFAACLAALSHLLLDVLSGAPLALAWPLSDTRVTLPLVAMADPWLVALFVVSAAGMWVARRQLSTAAVAVLLAVSVLFALKATFFARAALTIASDPRLQAAAPRALEARWASWTEWHVFERDADALRAWRVSGLDSRVLPLLVLPRERERPATRASRSLDTVRNFLDVHDFGFAVERSLGTGEIEVLWSDVRYCGQATLEGIECTLWFGGVLDAQGHAVRQLVYLRGWRQARQPSQ